MQTAPTRVAQPTTSKKRPGFGRVFLQILGTTAVSALVGGALWTATVLTEPTDASLNARNGYLLSGMGVSIIGASVMGTVAAKWFAPFERPGDPFIARDFTTPLILTLGGATVLTLFIGFLPASFLVVGGPEGSVLDFFADLALFVTPVANLAAGPVAAVVRSANTRTVSPTSITLAPMPALPTSRWDQQMSARRPWGQPPMMRVHFAF